MAETKEEVKLADPNSNGSVSRASSSNMLEETLPYGDMNSDLSDVDSYFSEDDGQKNLGNLKHRPVRRRGDRIVNDGSHNRSQAQVNHPDPSKLLIEFETETDHPTIKGQIVPGQPARHHYNDTVDWASKENVDKLNRWRNQVFCRSLGRKREPRPRWSALEVDFICGILEEHLETVGGRFSGIDWEKVAQLFNKVMDGRVQKAGEATAMGRYKGSAVSRKTCLKTDRRAPVRSSQAVKAQFERFTDPWAKEILEKAKNVDIQSLRGRKYEGGT